jgi:hypothetical protein
MKIDVMLKRVLVSPSILVTLALCALGTAATAIGAPGIVFAILHVGVLLILLAVGAAHLRILRCDMAELETRERDKKQRLSRIKGIAE